MKLSEAIEIVDASDFTSSEWLEPLDMVIQAAKDLQTLIEARENATAGEWRFTDHNWHESSVYGGDKYLGTFDLDCEDVNEDNQQEHEDRQTYDLTFITLAANTLEKYTER